MIEDIGEGEGREELRQAGDHQGQADIQMIKPHQLCIDFNRIYKNKEVSI